MVDNNGFFWYTFVMWITRVMHIYQHNERNNYKTNIVTKQSH